MPDIVAKRRSQNYYFYIEAKGDPATDEKLFTAIGQVVSCMVTTTPARYAMAFPVSFHRVLCDYLNYRVWKWLGIYVLLVQEQNPTVQEFKPTIPNLTMICTMP
jgi:hypothetical protein